MEQDDSRTDCLERPLSRQLRHMGVLVSDHAWTFFLLPLALSAALGLGFLLLPSRQSNDLESQFTPRAGPAKADQRLVQQHFPTRDGERFSAQRLTTRGTYASLLVVAREPNILNTTYSGQLWELDYEVRSVETDEGHSYRHFCARSQGSCASPNPLVSEMRRSPMDLELLLPDLTFPVWRGHGFMGYLLGGVTVSRGLEDNQTCPVQAAKALRLIYYLKEDEPLDRKASLKWLKAFLKKFPSRPIFKQSNDIWVAYFSSISRQEEFEKNSKEAISLFSITYTVIILFSVILCARCDCVRTKVWVAAFGVLSSGLAVVSSFGLLLLCGVPFVITAANAPFLILGVGVDDMFILVSYWQKTKVSDIVSDRMADTYAKAAVSVTITTLTDVLAFYIGTATGFPSIQSFCIYTGTAFIFCYIYNLTFLGATLALNGRREGSNRHWLMFLKLPTDSSDIVYNLCCEGGSYDETTGKELRHPMEVFFRNYFGPFLVHTWTKVFVVILYVAYLGSSIYGCTQVKEGIDLRNLASDDSYVAKYYDLTDEYFKEYGPRVMVIVTESISYWNPSVREDLENCMQLIENSEYVDKYLTESWLRIYVRIANELSRNINERNGFLRHLHLLYTAHPDSKWDIHIAEREITASRFFIQTVSVTSITDERNLLEELRILAADCKIPLIVYHPAFIYFDQYLVIAQNTIQTVVIATGAMILISLLLIPSPSCSLWVSFAVVSVIVGVIGFMAFWNVTLDFISMTNLVICIGFSVDFSAHISYAFVSSERSSMNDKAVDALYRLGYPIVQGALSTIVGVLVLSTASSYIFRTFFKIMTLVILCGAVHGLIFIPVFLTFDFCEWLLEPSESSSSVELAHETRL